MDRPAPLPLGPAYPNRAAWGTATSLRQWQHEALDKYFANNPRDFLAVATPGAGKTTFALTLAAGLLQRRVVDRITIVAPTEHLKTQWADAADKAGIGIDPAYTPSKGKTGKDFVGVAVTYAGVAANPLAFRVRTERWRTLVIFDEIHHAGDALSWGEAVEEAFEPATRRLALTGTPFRSDLNPIPFVTYARDEDGARRSVADYTYGYGEALADSVVRPVLFWAYSGDVAWRTRMGDEVSARLGEPLTRDQAAQALRTALDPDGAWVPAVLQTADRRLSEVRRNVPDAGGLVVATDQASARAYAALLTRISGERPAVVLSDDRRSSGKIAKFREGTTRWLVAVRMVSEGVDIPRLAVGVYATTTATPLFFAQAVGRLVRARRRGETASVFLPSVTHLLQYAAEMEVERDHVLRRPVRDEEDLLESLAARAEDQQGLADEPEEGYAALSSQASFDKVVYDGGEYGGEGEVAVGSDAEADFIGIPGLLEPHQVRALLNSKQAAHLRAQPADPAQAPARHRELRQLRRELNSLVAAWHHRSGQPHGAIHAELRRQCGGGPAVAASAAELQSRIDRIRDWAARPSR